MKLIEQQKSCTLVTDLCAELSALPRGEHMNKCSGTRKKFIGQEHIIGHTRDSFRKLMDQCEEDADWENSKNSSLRRKRRRERNSLISFTQSL